MTVAFASLPTEVGPILVAATDEGVAATSFGDSPSTRARITTRLGLPVVPGTPHLTPAVSELAAYFSGTLRTFTIPLDLRLLTPTQRQVLLTLHHTVPYGSVVTYGELARRSATDLPARAIGTIMGTNPIPILIPCHRVIATTNLGGFSAPQGLTSKRHLLTLEGHLPPTLW